MRICSPIIFKAQGGGFYFMRQLETYLQAQGHVVLKDVDAQYDVLLLNSWQTHYDDVLRAIWHNPRVRIVQRVDGSSENYGRGRKGDDQLRRIAPLVDESVFQSRYARRSTLSDGDIIRADGSIIYNAVDIAQFHPEGPTRDLPGTAPRAAYVTFSTNPMKGWPKVYEAAAANPDITFILVGRYNDPPNLPNLHTLGEVSHEDLPSVLRGCDLFLAFQRREACPNVVLEAMACGLPLLYVESGAIPELVADCGLPVDEDFRAPFDAVLAQQAAFSAQARSRAEQDFNPERVFGLYETVLLDMARRPRDLATVRRWLWAAVVKIGRPIRDALPGSRIVQMIDTIRARFLSQ